MNRQRREFTTHACLPFTAVGIKLLLYHHSPHVIGVSSHGGWVRTVHPPFPARFVRCTDPFEAVVTSKYIADHANGSRLAPELLYATVPRLWRTRGARHCLLQQLLSITRVRPSKYCNSDMFSHYQQQSLLLCLKATICTPVLLPCFPDCPLFQFFPPIFTSINVLALNV